jgi:hypothetical protein
MIVGMVMWLIGLMADHILLSELAAVVASFLSYGITLVAMRVYVAFPRQRLPV